MPGVWKERSCTCGRCSGVQCSPKAGGMETRTQSPLSKEKGEHAHSSNLWAQEEGTDGYPLFSVLCQALGSARGGWCYLAGSRANQNTSNAPKSFNQRLWQSGTWLQEAGLGQEHVSLIQRVAGQSQEHRQAAWPQTCSGHLRP